MIDPVELFLGLRYLRAKRRTRFVSFITAISLAGVALGVAALIVILSVMNGFESELRDRLVSMTAHGQISGPGGRVEDWRSLRQEMISEPGVAAAAPTVEMEGMIRSGSTLQAVVVSGVVPELEEAVSGITINFVIGGLDVLMPGANSIVLGRLLGYPPPINSFAHSCTNGSPRINAAMVDITTPTPMTVYLMILI